MLMDFHYPGGTYTSESTMVGYGNEHFIPQIPPWYNSRPSDPWANVAKRTSYQQAENDVMLNTHSLIEQDRNFHQTQVNTNGGQMVQGPFESSQFSFFHRKCRCAECIIANKNTEPTSSSCVNTRQYQTPNQDFTPFGNGYSYSNNIRSNGRYHNPGFVRSEAAYANGTAHVRQAQANVSGDNVGMRQFWREKRLMSSSSGNSQGLQTHSYLRDSKSDLELTGKLGSGSAQSTTLAQTKKCSFTQLLTSDLKRDERMFSSYLQGVANVVSNAKQQPALERIPNNKSNAVWGYSKKSPESSIKPCPASFGKDGNSTTIYNGEAASTVSKKLVRTASATVRRGLSTVSLGKTDQERYSKADTVSGRREKGLKRHSNSTENYIVKRAHLETGWLGTPESQSLANAKVPTCDTKIPPQNSNYAVRDAMESKRGTPDLTPSRLLDGKEKKLLIWGKQACDTNLNLTHLLSCRSEVKETAFRDPTVHPGRSWTRSSSPRVHTSKTPETDHIPALTSLLQKARELRKSVTEGHSVAQKDLGAKPKLKVASVKSRETSLRLKDSSISSDDIRSPNKNLQMGTQTDAENVQTAVEDMEACAREERIRNLKALLEKQEKAVDVLRCQLKPPPDEQSKSIGERSEMNSSSNKALHKESGSDETSEGDHGEECCSLEETGLCNPLKQRWLKNWHFKEEVCRKPKEGDGGHRENLEGYDDSQQQKADDTNENLSNAEYTALEGLVSLGKES